MKKQIDLIKKASENAQNKIDYYSAHNDSILHSIDVIEEFLRVSHRLCYGGQAINAHLPDKYKFYNPEYSIPDYDFFTPTQNKDIRMILEYLKQAGFTEISVREGMHEGTVKIYVNFIPVADITEIDPKIYYALYKRRFQADGISYLDANTLRMLMYLELSRPKGEVSRWDKVFERLLLFNEFASKHPCRFNKSPFRTKNQLTPEQLEYVLQYVIENKRIFAGADLLHFYENVLKDRTQNSKWILTSKKPILFYSSEPLEDAKKIMSELNYIQNKHPPIRMEYQKSEDIDLVTSLTILVRGRSPLVIIINQGACNSFFNIPIYRDEVLKIASIDTLITLYFSLGLVHNKYFNIGSMECLANKLVELSITARRHSNSFLFPFISIKCSGHQTSLPSLIRSKVERISSKKNELRRILENAKIMTRKNRVLSNHR